LEDSESGQKGGPWTRAKNRVQEFVANWAEKQGIDPKQIVFKWDVQEELVLPEHEITVNQKTCILRIYWGKRFETITFSGPSFTRSNQNPEGFLSENKAQVLGALRRLKKLQKGAGKK
jgi:hypothetical protein